VFLLLENIIELEHLAEVGSVSISTKEPLGQAGQCEQARDLPSSPEIQDGASNKFFSFNGPPCISPLKDKVYIQKSKDQLL
jgi:hypothetical protein